MCGIIFGANTSTTIKGKKQKTENINDFILNQYQDQSGRGTRGFGIIRIEKNKKIEIDRACEPTKFMLDLYLKPATMILAHHRMPTSTENKIKQTHPIKVSNKMLNFDYYVVHNGIIRNDEELRKKHMKLGFKYTTDVYEKKYLHSNDLELKWNDSEAIAVELALFIEKNIKEVRISGSISAAFIVLQVNKKTNIATKLLFGKNGSAALNMSKTRGNIIISSEGKGNSIKENRLYSFDVKDKNMKLSSQKIEFKEEIRTCETSIDEIKKEINKSSIGKQQTIYLEDKNKKDIKGTEVTVVRSWLDLDRDVIEELSYADPIFIGKNFKEEQCREFSGQIKDESTSRIKTILEFRIETYEEKITDIITSFKELCLSTKITKDVRSFYLSQIANVLQTIELITDVASDKYEVTRKTEDEAIMESMGYRADDPYNESSYDNDYGPKKSTKLLSKSQCFFGQGIRDDDEDESFRSPYLE